MLHSPSLLLIPQPFEAGMIDLVSCVPFYFRFLFDFSHFFSAAAVDKLHNMQFSKIAIYALALAASTDALLTNPIKTGTDLNQ